MPNLTSIYLGQPNDLVKCSLEYDTKLPALKHMFSQMKKNNKINLLKSLSLYECDIELMEIISVVAS